MHRLGLVALAVVAVACVAFGAWAYRTGIGWQDDALAAQSALHASQADAATLTAKQKQLQADLTSTRSTLKQAQTQLRDYTQRVGDIANEKAAIADTAAAASDKAEQAAALATQAANVADTLDGCITHLNELLRAVANSDGSDYIAIQVQGASVNAECSAAQQANDELQTQLAEQTQ